MTESELQKQILEYLHTRGIRAWRNSVGRTANTVTGGGEGCPDIHGIIKPCGRALYVEVKSEKGKLSKAQAGWLQTARDCGALVVVARSVKDVQDALDGTGKRE
jgi:hypothetical protein